MFLDALRDLIGRHRQMFRQQVVAQRGDRGARRLGARTFGGQHHVAFRVQPHRAVVEVRRPDPQIGVVDDRHLGMDIDLGTRIRHRVIDAQPVAMVQLAQRLDQLGAGGVHRHRPGAWRWLGRCGGMRNTGFRHR